MDHDITKLPISGLTARSYSSALIDLKTSSKKVIRLPSKHPQPAIQLARIVYRGCPDPGMYQAGAWF